MRLKRKSIIGVIAVVGALLLALAGIGFAQQGRPDGGFHGGGPGRHGGPGGHGGGPAPFLRELNLSDEQKAQIRKLTDSFEESTKSLREQARPEPGGEFDALKDGAFNEAAVRASAQARAGVMVELEVAHARLMSQIYNLLTAEQKAKVAELRQQFEQRRQEHETRRGGDAPAQEQ